MAANAKTYRIFISAAEPSADAHCAALITSLKQTSYNIEFVGVGGPKMAAAGCRLLEITVGSAVMAYNAFAYIQYYYKLIKRITLFLKATKTDLLIVCDSPAFNFHLAKAAKKIGLKTVFYVAPQLWAWAPWRIRKLRKYCDKLCCILPFEQNWFAEKGLDAAFVGNPMLDELGVDLARNKKKYVDFDANKANFALMPGSRIAEINTLWRPMQQIALRLKKKYTSATFTAAAVDDEKKNMLKNRHILGFKCDYLVGSTLQTAAAADFAIVASGSATLQVAAAGCPMVVVYQSSKILWHLVGRWLVTTKYLSLVNILAGKKLVPEFMPYFSSVEPIMQTIEQILENTDRLIQTSDELIELVQPLAGSNASQKTAQIIGEMLG